MTYFGLLMSFSIGAICAIRLPILHFFLLIIVGCTFYGLSYWGSGTGLATVIGHCIAYGISLQVGYTFANWLLYLVYAKLTGRQARTFYSVTRSKSSTD